LKSDQKVWTFRRILQVYKESTGGPKSRVSQEPISKPLPQELEQALLLQHVHETLSWQRPTGPWKPHRRWGLNLQVSSAVSIKVKMFKKLASFSATNMIQTPSPGRNPTCIAKEHPLGYRPLLIFSP